MTSPPLPRAAAARSTFRAIARLSSTECRAAAIDGELVAIGSTWMPIDLPETAAVRGSALEGEDLDPRVIISDRSAAWVWGWTHRPPRLSSSVSVAARIPSTDRRRLGTREVVIRADEVMALGAVRVTAPLRTLIDLARHDDGTDVIAMLARGLQEHAITSASIEHELRARGRLSYVRRARERLVAARAELDLLSRC